MKITLINPPLSSNVEIYSVLALKAPPLGLAYLAAVLEKDGYSVNIIDADALSFTLSQLKHRIEKDQPDMVGVTSTTPTVNDALKTVKIAKEACPEAVTVMGGPHVSFLPVETMRKNPPLDIVCIGEGERTAVELAHVTEKKGNLHDVKGIAYRSNSRIIINEPRELIRDLNSLPFPARHMLPMKEYTVLGEKYSIGGMITSRGCPFQCTFCSSSLLFGKKFRARSAKNVVDEMEHLHRVYKAEYVEFLDDIFTLDKKRVLGICNEILRRRLDMQWVCSSRVDIISKELMHAMKKVGCTMIYFGVESGNQRILNLMKKGIRVEQAVRAIKWAKRVGIETVATFIIGMLGETKDEIKRTIRFAQKLNPDYAQFSIATPFPGTELFAKARERGLIRTEDWSQYTVMKPIMATGKCSVKDLGKFISKAYRMFYLRPSYLLRQIVKRRFPLFKLVLQYYVSRAR